jgi:hypothetical protein
MGDAPLVHRHSAHEERRWAVGFVASSYTHPPYFSLLHREYSLESVSEVSEECTPLSSGRNEPAYQNLRMCNALTSLWGSMYV